jgi:hypothetical protein
MATTIAYASLSINSWADAIVPEGSGCRESKAVESKENVAPDGTTVAGAGKKRKAGAIISQKPEPCHEASKNTARRVSYSGCLVNCMMVNDAPGVALLDAVLLHSETSRLDTLWANERARELTESPLADVSEAYLFAY